MSRRHLTYAALVIASLVVSACAQPMGPSAEDTTRTCLDGTIIRVGQGAVCAEDL